MKPLLSASEDNDALKALGKASVQIVHDLKNQLNGLKLYATFLQKRLEKSERPADELETVRKLIAGLDRTAADVSLIVEFGKPLELKKQAGTDLEKLVRGVAAGLAESPRVSGGLPRSISIDASTARPLLGEFDSAALANAFKSISIGALRMLTNKAPEESLQIRVKDEKIETRRDGVIEWKLFAALDHDPFSSFAGSDEIRLALAARVIEAHGGSATRQNGALCVRLPLAS